jgi:site-specific DNA-methyltransferase (adenine-specific)
VGPLAGWMGQGDRRECSAARSEHGRALHPTQKPLGILAPLIAYSSDPGDLVLDPFTGAGSVLVASLLAGRRAVGAEADERYCEIAAKRLAQGMFAFAAAAQPSVEEEGEDG